MAGFSVEQAAAKLQIWLAAETALAGSQSYTVSGDGETRTLTRADGKLVADRINFWQAQLTKAERRANGRSRSRYFVN